MSLITIVMPGTFNFEQFKQLLKTCSGVKITVHCD